MIQVAIAMLGLLLSGPSTSPSQSDKAKSQELNTEGWKVWQTQNFAQAQGLFEKAVELDPANTEAWNGLGWSRMNQGKQPEAEQAFAKCIELAPGHPAALNGLGWIHFGNGKPDEAEKTWLKAEASSAAWGGLVQLYLAHEKWEQAEKYAQKLVDAGEAAGGGEWAKKLLKAAKEHEIPPEVRATAAMSAAGPGGEELRKGWKLFQEQKFTEAREAFEAVLEQQPDNPSAHSGLGWVEFNLGDMEAAKAHFEVALDASPDDGGAMNGMAYCLQREGKTDEAIEMWEQMAKLQPSINANNYGLATAYFERGDYDKALPILERLADQLPDNPQITDMLEQAKAAGKK